MKAFRITWGETTVVEYADDANTAWAQFAQGNEQARVSPNMFSRTVAEVDPAEAAADAEQALDGDQPAALEDTEIANLHAQDAVDKISRIRSHERLQNIIATEPRVTVSTAARDRLAHLENGGS